MGNVGSLAAFSAPTFLCWEGHKPLDLSKILSFSSPSEHASQLTSSTSPSTHVASCGLHSALVLSHDARISTLQRLPHRGSMQGSVKGEGAHSGVTEIIFVQFPIPPLTFKVREQSPRPPLPLTLIANLGVPKTIHDVNDLL